MKCVESNINGNQILSVRYLHRGNSSGHTRQRTRSIRQGTRFKVEAYTSPYISQATVRSVAGDILGVGEAVCSERDTPNRVLGRRIAVGRALAQVSGRYNG